MMQINMWIVLINWFEKIYFGFFATLFDAIIPISYRINMGKETNT